MCSETDNSLYIKPLPIKRIADKTYWWSVEQTYYCFINNTNDHDKPEGANL